MPRKKHIKNIGYKIVDGIITRIDANSFSNLCPSTYKSISKLCILRENIYVWLRPIRWELSLYPKNPV